MQQQEQEDPLLPVGPTLESLIDPLHDELMMVLVNAFVILLLSMVHFWWNIFSHQVHHLEDRLLLPWSPLLRP